MATKVTGELYESITGQLFEIGRQLRQVNGYPFDPERLQNHLQKGIEGRFIDDDLCFVFRNIPLEDHRLNEGWKIEKDADVQDGEFTFDLVPFCKDEESCISGEELMKRAQEQNCCQWGFRHAKQILENKQRIPKWMIKHYLVFPGSVWVDPDGDRDVPFLSWGGDRWYLNFRWLGYDFDSNGRFFRPRK